jgi:hypothetical protein
MIHIFTSVVNRPEFLKLQSTLFNKFLKNEYQFHVVYDGGIDKNILLEFETICEENNLILHKTDDWVIDPNPSTCISKVVKWIYEELMLKQFNDQICMIVDADMFLISDLDVEEYISDYPILGIPQNRGHVNYITNQLMVFNMSKIIEIDKDIQFMDGVVEGNHVDSCGEMHYWFSRNKINLKKASTVYPTHYNDIDLQNEEITRGINFEIYDDIFLHYRAGSNWFSKWKQNNDPLTKKKEIFEQIIENVLNDG